MCRRVAAPLVLLFLCLAFNYEVQAQRDPGVLEPGITHVHAITRSQSHRFSVVLEQDQCAQIVVDQRGVDLVIRVTGPNNFTGEFDGPHGTDGPENVQIAAAVAGTYLIDVQPLAATEPVNGGFEIRLTNIRRATELELQEARRPEILKAKGIEILHRLAAMLPEIRAKRTRLSLQIQAAQLLWPVDEASARRLTMDAAAAVRDYLQQPDDEDSPYLPPYSRAAQLRNEMFQMLVQHDPEFALAFLRDTRVPGIVTPQYNGQADQEIGMEMQVASSLAVRQPRRAFEIAQGTLSRGYSSQLGNVIATLRNSDPALAAALTNETVSRLQQENLLDSPEAGSLAISILRTARDGPRGSTGFVAGTTSKPDLPLLSSADYRTLFEKTLAEGLAAEIIPNAYSPESTVARNLLTSLKGMTEDLQNIAPRATAAVDEKLAQLNVMGNSRDRIYRDAINNSAVDVALEVISRAPRDLRDNLYFQLSLKAASAGDLARARQIATSMMLNPQQRQQALNNVERQAVQAAVNSGKLHEALEGITRLPAQRDRLMLATEIVARIGPGQKASAVVNFLEQFLGMAGITTRPQGIEQVNAVVLIAGAFARYDASRGFQMIEPFLDRFNELTDAALTLNGFGQQYFENGELALNNGNSLGTVAHQLADALAKLSVHDFERARNAVERIERPEVRGISLLAMARHMINPPHPWIRTR